jgi:hypothetical protein
MESGADPDPAGLAELGGRYGLEFQPESIPRLCKEHGLVHPLADATG